MSDFPYILGLKNVIELIVSNFQEAVFVLDDNKVAVLLEDLMSKFQTFGEGLELLNEKVDKGFKELRKEMNSRFDGVDKRFEENRQEHQQLMQMVKELDHEVQFEIKRVK